MSRLGARPRRLLPRNSRPRISPLARTILAAFSGVLLAAASLAHAPPGESLALPPQAAQALAAIYGGDPGKGLALGQALERQQPGNPLGYLVEAEARWWRIYCSACEIKWGMVDAWKRPKKVGDAAYLALAAKAVALARARQAESDSAEMHLYAGMGWALEARLFGLRDDRLKTARSGVAARAEFLEALRLDPHMADAEAGLGLYNYYADTLSPLIKFLRFFLGIPGGNKEQGIRQMREGMERGLLLRADARFYLAKNLRLYDHRYDEALADAAPLADHYPRNPIFQLLAGNLSAELGRKTRAENYFHAALAASAGTAEPDCAARTRDLAESFLASLL